MTGEGATGLGGVDLQRYEPLRARALHGETEGWRLDLGVLCNRGVAEWLRAWQCSSPIRPAPIPVGYGAPVAAFGGGELVGVFVRYGDRTGPPVNSDERGERIEGHRQPLARTAHLYVRQSTLRQVLHNTESTARQYALRQRPEPLSERSPKTSSRLSVLPAVCG